MDGESVASLRRVCFLDRIIALLEQEQRTVVQDAIVRSLYWFGDAHGDTNPFMRFTNLWTCVECFFAIEETEITEAVGLSLRTASTFPQRGE